MENKILDVIDMSVEGDGIARENELVYFIDGAVEGEKVEAELTRQKDNLIWGKLVKVIEPTFRRAEPPCPYFEKCGGCKIMHLNKETQALFKMLSLKRTIKKVTNLDVDIRDTVQSPKDTRYRNSIQLKVEKTADNDYNIGFYEMRTHNLVNIDDCLVCEEKNAVLISILKEYLKNTQEKIESVFASFFDNSLSILVQTEDGNCDKKLYDALKPHFDEVSLWVSKQFASSTLLNYKDAKFLVGSERIKVHFDNLTIEVTPLDFVQVNLDMAKILYDDIVKLVGTNKVVLDLFSGIGITSLMLAKNDNYVCSIEQIHNSVDSAKKLAQDNNLQDKIIQYCGDCADILPALEFSEAEKENLIAFLDPPRKGAGKPLIEALKLLAPKTIIYMSCNPTTLAKDVRDLLDTYEISSMQAYDMFPQTNNIESLTVLTIKEE